MSDLSEDLSEWPCDAFSLLGLSPTPGLDDRTLRRAYKQRIVRFKPEHFPEHFRRLRAAYEELQRYVEFQKISAQWRDEEDASDDTAAAESTIAAVSSASDDSFTPPPVEPPPPAPDVSAWKLAGEGKYAEAYNLLLDRQIQQPSLSSLYLRLYWLLSLFPQLDATRTAKDWLLWGLSHTQGEPGALRELFRRHVESDPALAFDDFVTRLIDTAEPNNASVFLEIRWRAAPRAAGYGPMRDDLNRFSQRIARSQPGLWLQMLTVALNHAAWSRDPAAVAVMRLCFDEIDGFDQQNSEYFDQLARIDYLRSVWNDFQNTSLEKGTSALLGLVAASWNETAYGLRPRLLAYLSVALRDPADFMRRLDMLAKVGPSLLAQFGQLLSSMSDYFPPTHDDAPDDDASSEIISFVRSHSWTPFHLRQRVDILQFCIREGVRPEQFADAIVNLSIAGGDRHLTDCIREDWPLHHAYLAYRVLHA